MTPRVVLVDGVPMSGLIAEAPDPAAVVVALHGGATTGAYFDCPDHPRLSLLRIGAALGFTVIALDRPGFGSSALYGGEFDDTPRRIDMAYRAVEALLGDRARGAGIFLLAHSNGSELALRMAADQRGPALLGIEISGTGVRQQDAARTVLAGATRERFPTGLRELLWEPARLYPHGVAGSVRIKSGPVSPEYEGTLVAHWQRDFPSLAAQVTVPVRFSLGEHERVWENGSAALAEVGDLFSAAPRVALHEQSGAGHNLSLGYAATAYHLSALSFVEECVIARSTTEFTVEAS
ncbi:alpha/beta fold hydrolase [Mycolicibacterium mengxianglii]|uniref:alpha/beta fold hydrolase n=1 Tax=Mycolicibacterium mengxianglii TaxID=2736649 RepID=UPI0027D9D522|nr:alpha/beta fold hydrolase [Mycolicibacterium mengxianglii]